MKDVFGLVAKLIKHAGKLVVSDAVINDVVLDPLKHRDLNDVISVQNDF